MLLLRSAPGVRCMSCRLTIVVGVAVSVGTTSGAAETFTVSWLVATLNRKCRTGCVPEMMTIPCCACMNPGLATETVYSPSGTVWNSNSPVGFEVMLFAQSEDFALSMTMAPCTGRCCGSWMMPRTAPLTAATALAAIAHSTARSRTRDRRMSSPITDEKDTIPQDELHTPNDGGAHSIQEISD